MRELQQKTNIILRIKNYKSALYYKTLSEQGQMFLNHADYCV